MIICRQASDVYLKGFLSGQLLCGGGAFLLNTIKHPGFRLEKGGEQAM